MSTCSIYGLGRTTPVQSELPSFLERRAISLAKLTCGGISTTIGLQTWTDQPHRKTIRAVDVRPGHAIRGGAFAQLSTLTLFHEPIFRHLSPELRGRRHSSAPALCCPSPSEPRSWVVLVMVRGPCFHFPRALARPRFLDNRPDAGRSDYTEFRIGRSVSRTE